MTRWLKSNSPECEGKKKKNGKNEWENATSSLLPEHLPARSQSSNHWFSWMYLKYNFITELDLVQLCETQKTSLNNRLFKNIPHVGSFWHFVICCIFVMIGLAHDNIIFDILEEFSFQKYTTYWVFLVLRYMLYLCIL